MIGRAGTGSPEAGIALRADPRVLVYTLWTGTRRDAQGSRTEWTVRSAVSSTSWSLFCRVSRQVSAPGSRAVV